MTKPLENSWPIYKRILVVFFVYIVGASLLLLWLNLKDRQQEWSLRQEQSRSRLELGYELINRDIQRVGADVLNVANQLVVQEFESATPASRQRVTSEFSNFLRYQKKFQQIRLVDLHGQEVVRVDLIDQQAHIVPESELQDKSDRYYIRDSKRLARGDVFVSEFDLNQERGKIEEPLNPVIRFVTPVSDTTGVIKHLLVINYLGLPLLNELQSNSLPGSTFLIRQDGQYILGPTTADAWGWLLNHQRTFDRQFPEAWTLKADDQPLTLHRSGAFAFRKLQLDSRLSSAAPEATNNQLLLVSYLPRSVVFETSHQLFQRLLLLLSILALPLYFLTRIWASGAAQREQQNSQIHESERQLRELSSRLLEIQEEERRAISREIHDELGQQATAINLDLKLIDRHSLPEAARSQVAQGIKDSEHLLTTLHHFATRVRPVELDDLGLHDAIESHLWEFQQRSGLQTDFASNIKDETIPPAIAENLFRLIQEALNNILRHAHATTVQVSIQKIEEASVTSLQIVVADDGVGTATKAANNLNNVKLPQECIANLRERAINRLGIPGMRERVKLFGGELQIIDQQDNNRQRNATQGTGTIVKATIPLFSQMSN